MVATPEHPEDVPEGAMVCEASSEEGGGCASSRTGLLLRRRVGLCSITDGGVSTRKGLLLPRGVCSIVGGSAPLRMRVLHHRQRCEMKVL